MSMLTIVLGGPKLAYDAKRPQGGNRADANPKTSAILCHAGLIVHQCKSRGLIPVVAIVMLINNEFWTRDA